MTSRHFALRLILLWAAVPFVTGCGQKSAPAEPKTQAQVQDAAQQRATDLANHYQQQSGHPNPSP